MRQSRRNVLQLAAGLVALATDTRIAGAQNYPTRPVRIVSGFPPGGINDTYARLIGQWLSEHLGQQFIVENRPGAGGTLAAEMVAKAPPDGYTLLLTTSADAWNATLYQNLNFTMDRDFVPVATISRGPGVLVVHPSLPVTSVPELITYAKSNPGKLTIASAGIGSAPHMYWDYGCLAGSRAKLGLCRNGFRAVRFPAIKRNRELGGYWETPAADDP